MARSSASSSRKLCPPNKFSFMSGCMAWSTILSLISLFALLIVCMLIMSSRDIKYEIKKNDIIEEQKLIYFFLSKENWEKKLYKNDMKDYFQFSA